ncbi:MAG: hypothetical protein HPZ91_00550 [Lentisphaeria bacterium]|nr:hypothetical protein [Lentisphaeria bacterium]
MTAKEFSRFFLIFYDETANSRKLPSGKTPLLLVLGSAPRPEKFGRMMKLALMPRAFKPSSARFPPWRSLRPKRWAKGDLIIKLKEEACNAFLKL